MINKKEYENLFGTLTEEEISCLEMCDSLIVYSYDKKSHYLDKYREELGNSRVEYLYDTLEQHIKNNYNIVYGGTDGEGVGYLSLQKK